MTVDPNAVYSSLLISIMATALWVALAGRMLWATLVERRERRAFILAMPAVGLLAAIGTLASVIGLGQATGMMDLGVSSDALIFVSGMGRGALLMGGAIALAYYQPT